MKPETVLVLRTCSSDLTSHGGFQWPKKGPVSCPDWKPKPECGNGLHGLKYGHGDTSLMDHSEDAKWLVVKVLASDIVEIDNKVKFPKGEVMYSGTKRGAVSYLAKNTPADIHTPYRKVARRFRKFTENGVLILRDKVTGLEWDANGSPGCVTHKEAEAYCARLGDGWRMPTLDELKTLVDHTRKRGEYLIDTAFQMNNWWYWSSTLHAAFPDCAWIVSFYGGLVDRCGRGLRGACVRAVRASQS